MMMSELAGKNRMGTGKKRRRRKKCKKEETDEEKASWAYTLACEP